MKNSIKTLIIAGAVIGATAAWAEPRSLDSLSHKKDVVVGPSEVNQVVYSVGQGKYRPFRANSSKQNSASKTDYVATSADRFIKRKDRNI